MPPIADASTNHLGLPPVRSAEELYLVSPKHPDFDAATPDEPFFSAHLPEDVAGHDARNAFTGLYIDHTAEDIAPRPLPARKHRLFDLVVRGWESLRGRTAARLGGLALADTRTPLNLRLL